MKNYLKIAVVLLVGLFVFSSCEDEDEQARIDEQIIEDYLAENNISAKRHSSGLYYKILTEGTGINPSSYSSVEVKYKGYLIDGSVFDKTSGDATISFSLMSVIEGWQIGIPLIREGGSAQLFIPSGIAYGDKQVSTIPPNSVLIFDVDLIKVY